MNVKVSLLVRSRTENFRIEMAYLVIEWLKKGDKLLKPPQLEAIGSTKVIALNGREEGKPVMMQFKDSLWQGKILSLHGKTLHYKPVLISRLEMLHSGWRASSI